MGIGALHFFVCCLKFGHQNKPFCVFFFGKWKCTGLSASSFERPGPEEVLDLLGWIIYEPESESRVNVLLVAEMLLTEPSAGNHLPHSDE